MTDAAKRRRTAYHEAGHAVVGLVMGMDPQFVSLRPGASHHGMTKHSVPQERRIPNLDALLGTEVVLTDPAARVTVERAIVATLYRIPDST